MAYVEGMAVTDGTEDLSEASQGFFFRKPSSVRDMVKEFTILNIFEDQVSVAG
jgi:hypothetical protein